MVTGSLSVKTGAAPGVPHVFGAQSEKTMCRVLSAYTSAVSVSGVVATTPVFGEGVVETMWCANAVTTLAVPAATMATATAPTRAISRRVRR